MERFEDDRNLIEELRALRPQPRDEFAAELDERAAAGFPRRRLGALAGARRKLWSRARSAGPRRLAVPAAAVTLVAVTAAVALAIAIDDGGNGDLGQPSTGEGHLLNKVSPVPPHEIDPAIGSAISGGVTEIQGGRAPTGRNRVVERWSKVFIGAPAADVPAVASEVLAVTDASNGIVVNSTVREGDEAGANRADANFQLLIPSGKVREAMEGFSSLGDVISRRDSTADITARTVGARERAKGSRARIEGLLGRLAAATSETEREAVETALRRERRALARLEGRLERLRERAQLSRVDVRIVGDGAESGSGWGLADGLDDAGTVLSVSAGAAIVAIAVLGPLALIALLVWLARRAWLTWSRNRALG